MKTISSYGENLHFRFGIVQSVFMNGITTLRNESQRILRCSEEDARAAKGVFQDSQSVHAGSQQEARKAYRRRDRSRGKRSEAAHRSTAAEAL